MKFIMITQTIRNLLSDEVGQKKFKIYLLWFMTVVNLPANYDFRNVGAGKISIQKSHIR